MKSWVDLQLAYLHLTLSHSIGYGQGHAHLDSEYLANGDILGEHPYLKYAVILGFHWHIYI